MNFNRRLICIYAGELIREGKTRKEAFKFSWDLAKKGIYIKDPNENENDILSDARLEKDRFDFNTDKVENLSDLIKQADEYCINAEKYEIVDDAIPQGITTINDFISAADAFTAKVNRESKERWKEINECRKRREATALRLGYPTLQAYEEYIHNQAQAHRRSFK